MKEGAKLLFMGGRRLSREVATMFADRREEAMKYCGSCGGQATGQYCGGCGQAVNAATEAPTTMAANGRSGEHAATTVRPQQPQPNVEHSQATQSARNSTHHADDAPAWWSSQSGNGYGAGSQVGQPAAFAEVPTNSHRRRGIAPFIAGAAALALLAGGGYFMLGQKDGNSADAATPSTTSMSPAVSTPSETNSTAAPSTGSSPAVSASEERPSPTHTVTETAPAAPSEAEAPRGNNSGGNAFDGLNTVSQTSVSGTQYAAAASGNNVDIYEDQGGSPVKVSSITVAGTPYSESFHLVNVPGCQKPVLAYNAEGSRGSAAYSWNGSAYGGLKASGDNLYPTESANGSATFYTYRITTGPGRVTYYDSASSPAHNFLSCTDSNGSDALVWHR